MPLTSKRYKAEDLQAVQEFYHSRGWTDGLPVVPPTPEAVQACLDWATLSADHLVGIEPVRGRAISAEKLAVNAVMAGCLPMHFPVVVAAFTAMLQEPFLLHGAIAVGTFVYKSFPTPRQRAPASDILPPQNNHSSIPVS